MKPVLLLCLTSCIAYAEQGMVLDLSMDKQVYEPNEAIEATLVVSNEGTETIQVRGESSRVSIVGGWKALFVSRDNTHASYGHKDRTSHDESDSSMALSLKPVPCSVCLWMGHSLDPVVVNLMQKAIL